ncbi:MAG: hypothetical protein IJZ10_08595 [Thermoguttaceae bacterium]|nr:hypothetical protein [Thermoguttaceae bacterium]
MAIFNDHARNDRQEQTFKSLCCVEGIEGFSIRRLADVDENSGLRRFERQKEEFPYSDWNHFYNGGSFEVGAVEIIQWKPEPNRNDPSKTFFRLEKSKETPILVCPVPSARHVEEVKERLRVGVNVKTKGNVRALFVPSQFYQSLIRGLAYGEGALCTLEECDCKYINGETVWKLKPETAFLPVFKISSRQTIDIKCLNEEFCFVRFLDLGNPTKDIAVKTPKEIALDVLNEKWPSVVNAAKELTRGGKQPIKKCFESLPGTTIVEEIARRYKCSLEEAETHWEETRQYVDGWVEAEDADIKAFIKLLESNDELRERYYDFWRQQFENRLKEEEKKTSKRREAAEKELQNILDQSKRAEEEYNALKDKQKRLTDETAALASECERKKNALRQIERELSEAIRREWSAAEENAAEFWAKKLVFSTETRRDGANRSDDGKNVRKSSLFTPGTVFRPLETDKIDKLPPPKILEQNLKRRVVSDYNRELAAFAFSAFSRRQALILAGPCGERIAEALAAACGGRRPGTLRCDGDWNGDAVALAADGDDEIVLAKNALNPRWVDRWPDAVAESPKQWILTTPFRKI